MIFLTRMGLFFRASILNDARAKEFKRWFDDKGDERLRASYALNENSIVFDLGGYKGDFSAEIHRRYQCEAHLFEPVPEFHAICVERFKHLPKIHCHRFGLSSTSGVFAMSKADNGSTISAAVDSASNIRVTVESVTEFLQRTGIENVSLMKINIEGGEYDLLPALIDSGKVRDVENLQVQFHDFIPGAEVKRNQIRELLGKTHAETWSYRFVWENWSKVPDKNIVQQ